MPRRDRRADGKDDTNVVELKQNSSSLASTTSSSRVAPKLEREPRLSCGVDPGPSGLDWKELNRTDDSN
jgi:hypothetical protein